MCRVNYIVEEVEIGDPPELVGIEFNVDCKTHRGCVATYEEPAEPDTYDAETVEVVKITTEADGERDPTEAERAEAEAHFWEHVDQTERFDEAVGEASAAACEDWRY